MPRYFPNMTISDCWSSVGQVSFYHRDGQCFWRKKASPSFPGTLSQMRVQDVHSRALQSWRVLEPEEQEQWNEYAKSVPSSRPPYSNDTHISGHNLFVSAYHGFATLGVEQVPTPRPYEQFPIVSCSYHSAETDNDDSLRLRLKVNVLDCENPQRYRLAVRIQLTKVGGGKRPGYMRSFVAESNFVSADGLVEICLPDYQKSWRLESQESQAHMRYFLLDTETGYRSKYSQISFIIA